MAISFKYETYGMLNRWQDEMEVDPFHFNQAAGLAAPFQNEKCNAVWIQRERERVARALNAAWNDLSRELGFWPRPLYTNEWIELKRSDYWAYQTHVTRWRYLQAFGRETSAVIEAGASVAYSDADGDGVNETATITVASTSDVDQVRVYFRTTDGAPAAKDALYEISPLTIRASGANIVITGHAGLFVKPSKWKVEYDPSDPNSLERNDVNTVLAASYVTAVDVYRVYTDDTIQAQAVNRNNDVLLNVDCVVLDSERGLWKVDDNDCSALTACLSDNYPVRLKIHYLAGYSLDDNLRINSQLETAVIRLSNTLQPGQPCTLCDQSEWYWQEDRQVSRDSEFGSLLQERDTANPFGLRAGAIAAWRVVRDFNRSSMVTGGKFTGTTR